MFYVNVEMLFTNTLLGTAPAAKDLYKQFVIDKARAAGHDIGDVQEEFEIDTVADLKAKGHTVFRRLTDGTPIITPHMIVGFLKEKAKALRYCDGADFISRKIRAYRQIADLLIYPGPKAIPLVLPEGWNDTGLYIPSDDGKDFVLLAEEGTFDHVVRASTPQGQRVAITCSEGCPPGTTMRFWIKCKADQIKLTGSKKGEPKTAETYDWLAELFDCGADHGFGQWRNAQYGTFVYQMSRMDEPPAPGPSYAELVEEFRALNQKLAKSKEEKPNADKA